ncbi:hypothetical protein GALMADRAFT_244605 [Galerina marginata CBS 339.88]|uniref:DUF1295-domain-containing protein n=1 Tax=Galerina marginata (strain CBS 339.88) TaxID=685588 RepID=A0A067TJ40_GALM3|nr:hypothetical protein GALMADRAFT_244605 [Galerina marginata CBS 339.88]
MTLFNLPDYLDWPVQFCLFTTAATWLASLITSNVSQVDRLWTFLPTIYTAYYALLPLLPNEQPYLLVPYAPKGLRWTSVRDFSPRALLMLGVVFTWMCRLSYNTYRRGLFSLKDEDYRWAVLRKQLHPVLFQITNLTFIAFIQNVLLLLLGLPTYVASVLQSHTPLTQSDYALAAFALTVLAFEFTADNQQFAFHAYKHAYLANFKLNGKGKEDEVVKPYNAQEQWPGARLAWTPDDARRGFITRGLWRYSRHPNFACEQSFWWIITLIPLLSSSPPYLFPGIPALGPFRITVMPSPEIPSWDKMTVLNTTILPTLGYLLPALALSSLFFSSTIYTEAITKSKYTEAYAAYQTRVGMFTPLETLFKALKLKFLDGEKEKRVESLVWGNSSDKDD